MTGLCGDAMQQKRSAGDRFKVFVSLKAATMAMKTGLLWVRTVRVGDLARRALDFNDW